MKFGEDFVAHVAMLKIAEGSIMVSAIPQNMNFEARALGSQIITEPASGSRLSYTHDKI